MSQGWKRLLPLLFLLLVSTGRFALPSAAQEAPTPTPTPDPADAIVDWRFGVVESHQAPGHARNLGAAWSRVRFQWADVQAGGPATWTPEISDPELAEQLDAGREMIGLLIGIPDWARDDNRLPTGLYLPVDDPENRWAVFVREAVTRYQGRIDHWVIWNEPDIWDANALGHTWDGSEADFARLLKVAYLAARQANPDVVIHLPAFTYFWDANFGREQYIGRLFDAILADPEAAANNYYFDVMTAHLYFNPDQVYNIIRTFDDIRAEKGIPHKPIWLMETNAPLIDDPLWPVANWTLAVSGVEQAYYMPQVVAAALAAGAERVGVYKLKDVESDTGANPEPFGLIRSDGTRRPAFDSYRTAMEFMAAAQGATRERWDAVGQVRVDQEDRTTTVLFSRLPAPQVAQVEAIASTAFLVDTFNQRRVFLDAEDGIFNVELPPALCSQSIGDYCMIGGETFYLIQARDGGPAPVLPPAGNLTPPLPTPSATPPPPPSPTAGSPAAASPSATPPPTATGAPTDTPPATRVAQVDGPPPPPTATDQPAGGAPTPTPTPTPTAAPAAPTGTTALTGLLQAGGGDPSVWIAGGLAIVATLLLLAGIIRRIMH